MVKNQPKYSRRFKQIVGVLNALFLSLLCGACFHFEKKQTSSNPETNAPEPTTVLFPTSDPTLDALFCGPAGTVFSLPMEQGDYQPEKGVALPSENRLYAAPLSIPNRVMLLELSPGYLTEICSVNNLGETSRVFAEGTALLYGYKNARWAFILSRSDGMPITRDEASVLQIRLIDPDAVGRDDFGFWQTEPFWGRTAGFGNVLSVQKDEQVSSPLPLSDGGLGILFNGSGPSAAKSYRAVFYRFTDDGVIPAREPALQALSAAEAQPAQSLYFPQTEGCYASLILSDTADPDLLTLTGGAAKNTPDTRLCGLFNMDVRLDGTAEGPVLQMVPFYSSSLKNGQPYLGALLRASDVISVRSDARFELTATLWKNVDGMLKRTKTYWNGAGQTGEPRGSAILTPDPSDEGFLLLCVRRRAQPLVTPAGIFEVQTIGMGAMRGYGEVESGVVVEYKAGTAPRVQSIENPVLAQNLTDIMSESVPYVYSGAFSRWQDPGSVFPYTELFDCAPVWYNGRDTVNVYLNHISPRSYLTAAANPNSLYYSFNKADGYGSSCNHFALAVFGITEVYPIVNLAYGNNLVKFTRESFNYQTQAESLVPGEILMRMNPETEHGHLMVVKDVIRDARGQLYGVTVVEGWPPFSRLRTLYFTGASQAEGSLLNMSLSGNMDEYVYRLRVKPEYIRPLSAVFDMHPDLTVGTVMCDRGSDAVYCMGAQKAEFSVTDPAAKMLILYRNGVRAATLSLDGAIKRNGCRLIGFAHLLTAPGLYTVYTDTSDAPQERFYVPDKKAGFHTKTVPGADGKAADVVITVPDLAQLECIRVFYRRTAVPTIYTAVYPPEAVASTGNGDGVLTVPAVSVGGRSYAYTRVMYRTPYGTFWIGYSDGKLIQTAEAVS